MEEQQPKRHIRFSPLPVSTAEPAATPGRSGLHGQRKGKFGRKHKPKSYVRILKELSPWEWVAFALMLLSTIMFTVSFLTNGWGMLIVSEEKEAGPAAYSGSAAAVSEPRKESVYALAQKGYNATEGEYWEFGLWQCCRNDGFCLGTRFPPFYIAARTFCTLALVGHIITLFWFVGHSAEKILLYDKCAYSCLISFIWFTAICVLIAVSSFGGRWPIEFAHEFHGNYVYLNYAFYMAVVCCPLMISAGVCILVHMIITRDYFLSLKADFLTAEELLGQDEEGNVKYV